MSETLKALIKTPNITIVVASKYFNTTKIEQLYQEGFRYFGENRVADFLAKKETLKNLNIKWHFIGHLQRNKVHEIINEIDCLHSLDSLALANLINKNRLSPLNCFIEVNLSGEQQKYGVLKENLASFYQEIRLYDKIKVIGLMVIGVNGDLCKTAALFQEASSLNRQYGFKALSMGMTDDYLLAIENGATHLRIGRLFKGE